MVRKYNRKVTIVVGGTFHAPLLAKNLRNLGVLNKVITSMPKFLFNNLDSKDIVTIPMLTQILDLVFKISVPKILIEKDIKLFGTLAARFVKNTDILHGWAGFSLESGRKIRKENKKFVLERSCPHILFQESLLKEEEEKLKIKFKKSSKSFINRHLKEYELADKIIVPSKYTYKSFTKYGFSKEKLYKIPLLGKMNILSLKEINKRKKKNNIFRVGFLGGNMFRKGLIYLLEAWDMLNFKNIELVIKAPEKQVRKSPIINKYLNKLKNIRFVGYYKNISDFYLNIDLFCLPSVDDGFGMVVIEAMAHKVPVIVTKNVGASEYIENGRHGYNTYKKF